MSFDGNGEPKEYVAGSSSLVLGCDSYTSPAELGDSEYVFGQNVTCRGGIVQTRPGSRSMYCAPNGNFQGFKLFTPDNGVAHHVFAVDGAIYVSAAPFTSYRRLWSLNFSKTAKYVSWAVCLKSNDYDNEGILTPLQNPYSVLVIQDGVTRAGYWDGSTARHLNPGSPAYPDNTDNVPGYNETPIGLWMIWSGNRLWVSRGNQIFAGDIGNPLKFTETLYLNEARAFNLSGPCTGMIEVPSDSAGAKGFIAFTDNDGTLFASYIQDRTTWLSTPLFQNTILPHIGCVAPRSLITQYGLNWWFGPRGMTNINSALRENITSRIDYQDNEMFSSKAYLGPDLSSICGSFYENYLMMSTPSGDVLNRHTWVLDQAPFDSSAPAWTGIWTGWRPIEWSRGLVNGNERVFFASKDFDGRNRVWEAMLSDRTDNGCRITCYAQLRDHAAGNLNQKRYNWSKFFLSQIYGEVDLSVYVASTKGAYQLQMTRHIVASEGQIFADKQYSEAGPFMIGNRVQSRTIRTPSHPDDNACNSCGVESPEGNMIDYAFSHLLVWSGQMGIRAYQIRLLESPERMDGDCEDDEVAPRTLNVFGCSGLELFVDGQPLSEYSHTAEGSTYLLDGTHVYIQRTFVSVISLDNAIQCAECAVQSIVNQLAGIYSLPPGAYGDGIIVDSPPVQHNPSIRSSEFSSSFGIATLCGFSEYTTPSSPPKKYRKESPSGSQKFCVGGGCSLGVSLLNYNGAFVYSPTDCSTANTEGAAAFDGTGKACSAGFTPSAPVSYIPPWVPEMDGHPATIFTQSKTIKQWSNPGTCTANISYSGTVTQQLSEEDTEDDAIARATPSGTGTSPTASRETRGAGDFTFNWQNSIASVVTDSLIPGTNYRITFQLLIENYGGGSPVNSSFNYDFTAASVSESFNIPIPVASGKQATASSPTIDYV